MGKKGDVNLPHIMKRVMLSKQFVRAFLLKQGILGKPTEEDEASARQIETYEKAADYNLFLVKVFDEMIKESGYLAALKGNRHVQFTEQYLSSKLAFYLVNRDNAVASLAVGTGQPGDTQKQPVAPIATPITPEPPAPDPVQTAASGTGTDAVSAEKLSEVRGQGPEAKGQGPVQPATYASTSRTGRPAVPHERPAMLHEFTDLTAAAPSASTKASAEAKPPPSAKPVSSHHEHIIRGDEPHPEAVAPEAPASPSAAMPEVKTDPAAPVLPAKGKKDTDTNLPLTQWSWLPTPTQAQEPEFHSEDAELAETFPGGFNVISVRSRGKSHKHKGTHCDDWFATGQVDRWGIIAVADGAGSCRLSRVGAKVSCHAVVNLLHYELGRVAPPDLRTREEWTAATQRLKDGSYQNGSLRLVAAALLKAMSKANQAVIDAAEEQKANPEWTKILGREVQLKDLRSTLLITVVAMVPFEQEMRALCMSLQIGDGATVVHFHISGQAFAPQQLSVKDTGLHAGEANFVVDSMAKPKEVADLGSKISVVIAPLRVLFSMTDGVDDVYDPRTGRNYDWLLAELLLNQVLPIQIVDEAAWDEELRKVIEQYGTERIKEATTKARQPRKVRIMEPPEEPICILDVGDYASALRLKVPDLLARPALIAVAHRFSEAVSGSPLAAHRLLAWIDGKDVRGEADDRTMVILYPASGVPL